MQSFTYVAALTLLVTSGVVNAGTEKTIAPSPVPATPEPTDAPLTAAPTPCDNRLFYIITIDSVTKCSNGYDAKADTPDYFDSSTECCAYLTNEGMIDNSADTIDYSCKVIDVCNPTEAPTEEPTPSPTEEPTPAPYAEIILTPEPTPAPVSDEPTVKPSCAPTVRIKFLFRHHHTCCISLLL
jgi:hypothetical protein